MTGESATVAPKPHQRQRRRSKWALAAERRLTPRSWLEGVWRQWPLMFVLVVVVVGLVMVPNNARAGGVVLALGVMSAAVFRAILPESRAGVLSVRSRMLDVLILTAFGVGTLVAALLVRPLG